jgi:hypothetical protein
MVQLVALLVVFYVLLFLFIWLRVEVCRLSSAEAIAGVVVQLGKAKDEILARIAGLEAAAAAGEDLSGPLAELAAAAQALDDVVPDAVVEAPVEVVEVPAVVEGEQV